MKKYIILLLALFVPMAALQAQKSSVKKAKKERTIALWGHVKNSFTKVGIPDVKVTLMDEDSTFIDSMRVWVNNWSSFKMDASFKFTIPARPRKYIILAQHPEYYDCYVNYEVKHIARNTYFDAPWHYMRRRDPQADLLQMLDEVEITATKVRIAYKGDTIIYNADAFKTPKGSMLDELVRQLPGVELKDNGEITVNGEKIDYLTLNGKDFFKGNNKVMLDNLPNYVVENIITYHKSTEKSQYLGREVEKKDFVMDVKLKREYSIGYLANADVAGGSSDRFMARFFGLRYTDNSRISLFGNMNNVNESRKPGSKGEWSPSNMPQGQQTVHNFGLDIMVDDKDKRWVEKGMAQLSHTKENNVQKTATESFLSSGTSYSRAYNHNVTNTLNLSARNEFTINRPFRLRTVLDMNYKDNEGDWSSRFGQFDADPSRYGTTMEVLDSLFAMTLSTDLQSMAVNRRIGQGLNKSHSLDAGWDLHFTQKLRNGDSFEARFSGGSGNNRSRAFALNNLDYLRGDEPSDCRNEYTANPSNYYRYDAGLTYGIHWLDSWNLDIGYTFNQSYNDMTNNIHRLDMLDGWDDNLLHTIGMLPSTQDSLLMCLDAENSYNYNKRGRTQGLVLLPYFQRSHDGKDLTFRLCMPFKNVSERLNYHSLSTDTCATQNQWVFNPDLYVSYRCDKDGVMRCVVGVYSLSMELPSLYDKIDVSYTNDPLSIRKGNPNLKSSSVHRMQVAYMQRVNKRQQWFNFTYGLRFFPDQIARGYVYDAQTGAYTYTRQNMDGNWQTYIWTTFSRAIDKDKHWQWSTTTHCDYAQNVDLAAVEGSDESSLSKVDNYYVNENLFLNYRLGKLSASLVGNISWRCAHGSLRNTQDINAVDFFYGVNGTFELPAGIILSTDMKMFSRRGYGDSSMNTDDLVWNLSLSRSFWKNRMTARLEAFDIFNQVSGNSIVMNGQGRVETVRNALPRYVMMHLTYNFSFMPKKR